MHSGAQRAPAAVGAASLVRAHGVRALDSRFGFVRSTCSSLPPRGWGASEHDLAVFHMYRGCTFRDAAGWMHINVDKFRRLIREVFHVQ